MAHFTKAAVTDVGNELLNEMMAGRYVRVTRAAGGTGTVEEDRLHEQTGLQEEKQALSIIDDAVDKQGRTIAIQIGNAETPYPLEQVGVFGKLEDVEGDEELLFILQDDDPITVPDANAPTFMLNIYAHLNINNVGRSTVTIDKTGIVNIEFLERKLSEIQSIPGEGAPTPKTAGQLGQHYFDATTGTEYICKKINEDGTFVWEEAGSVTITGEGAPTPETIGTQGQIYFDKTTGTTYTCTAVTLSEEKVVYTWEISGASRASMISVGDGEERKTLEDTLTSMSEAISGSEPLSGKSAPTTETKGAIGQTYLDETTGDVYVCTAVTTVGETTTYTWKLSGGDIALKAIAIISQPTKTSYRVGDRFDTSDMVVEATYSNGAKLVVGGYIVSPTVMTLGTEYVTVTYTEGGVSTTARQAVMVSKRVPTITVSPESVTLDADHLTVAATVTTDSDGEIGVLSNDTGIAAASIDGTVITVEAVDNTSGSTTLSVTTEETDSYAAGSETVNVNASFGRLPSGYTELQYLTFSKNQLFKTSIDGTRIQKIDGKFKTDNTSWGPDGNYLISGPDQSIPVRPLRVVCAQNRPGANSQGWEFQTQPNDPPSVYHLSSYYDTNTLYEFSIMLPNSLTINGDIVSLTHFNDNRWTKIACDPITIGGAVWVEDCGISGDLYYLNLYDESDEPILLLIPCKRNSDDKLGMYDTVTETFFTNNGTGDFIAGPAV